MVRTTSKTSKTPPRPHERANSAHSRADATAEIILQGLFPVFAALVTSGPSTSPAAPLPAEASRSLGFPISHSSRKLRPDRA